MKTTRLGYAKAIAKILRASSTEQIQQRYAREISRRNTKLDLVFYHAIYYRDREAVKRELAKNV